MIPEIEIQRLNVLRKTYDGLTQEITKLKNRLGSLHPDSDKKNDPMLKGWVDENGKEPGYESYKRKLKREMEKRLKYWPIYTQWLQHIPGIGPAIAANLILKYYYRFQAICKECGGNVEHSKTKCRMCDKEYEKGLKFCPVCEFELEQSGAFVCVDCGWEAKGEGNLCYKIEERDFNTISKWWSFMGRGIDPATGKMPKRGKGKKSNWSHSGRLTGFMFYNLLARIDKNMRSCGKPPNRYYQFMLGRKAYRQGTHPKEKPGYWQHMAGNETAKRLLSHFWIVARVLDGKELSKPWILQHGGHVDFDPPYYMSPELEEKVMKAYEAL